jgi:hypothetical protein
MPGRSLLVRRASWLLLLLGGAGLPGTACVEPLSDADTVTMDTGVRMDVADARQADAATPPSVPDSAPGLDAPPVIDGSPDAAPADAAPADAQASADTAPADTMASPCPGGPAPPDHGLRCGCATLGTVTCAGTCSVDDTSCVPTGQFYMLSNTFLGDGRVLDTYGGGPPNNAFMNTPCCSGSNWKITALGGGYYSLTNMFMLDTYRLEAAADGSRLFLGAAGTAPAQAWLITGAGNGTFRIRNKALGAGKSLDTKTDGNNDPWMRDPGDFSGQYWKITKK